MSAWRVIGTDTESFTGVAQVCDQPDSHIVFEDSQAGDSSGVTGPDVFDCCRGPHLECWDERRAADLAKQLTAADAEPCS